MKYEAVTSTQPRICANNANNQSSRLKSSANPTNLTTGAASVPRDERIGPPGPEEISISSESPGRRGTSFSMLSVYRVGSVVICCRDQSGALRDRYRDPSLGVARFRARLRCLRMTILGLAEGGGWDRAHGSPDSAVQRFWNAKLLPWGKFGALHLGEEEMYSGELGASRAADRSVRPTGGIVGSLRGLGRVCGLVAWLKPCPSLSRTL